MDKIELFSTFPEGVEMSLVTFLNLCYATCTIPIRFQYSIPQKKYIFHVSIFRKILCSFRLVINCYMFIVFSSYAPSITPGPTGLIIAGAYNGLYLVGIWFFVTVLRSSNQNRILELINLCKGDSHHSQKGKIFVVQNIWMILNVLLVSFVSIYIYTYYNTSMYFEGGIEMSAISYWYNFIKLDRNEARRVVTTMKPNDFEWWKKCAGAIFMFAQADQQMFLGVGLVLFIFIAKTLEESCDHLTTSIRDTQRFCNVSGQEIICRFWKLRKMFTLVSRSFGAVAFLVITAETLLACINLVWVFKNDEVPVLATVNTFTSCFGCLYFLLTAAKASRQLFILTRFLHARHSHFQAGSSNCLRKHILIHEISSGKVGLNCCGVFVVTYGFIAGLLVTLLSNTAIVLQSFEIMMKSFSPPTAEPKTASE